MPRRRVITDSDECTAGEGIARLARHAGHVHPHPAAPPPPATPEPGLRTRGPRLRALPPAGPVPFRKGVSGAH